MNNNNSILEAKIKDTLNKYKDKAGSLIPALTEVQNIYGYLPYHIIKLVAEELDIPSSIVYGVVSFYSFFSTSPRGRHIIKVCMGTACYATGGNELLSFLKEELNVEVGGITQDRRFSLEVVRCLGTCGLAPVIMIDSDIYGNISPPNLKEILEEYP